MTLHEFQDIYFEKHPTAYKSMEEQLNILVKLVEKSLPQENGYTREEIATLLSPSVQELEDQFMIAFPVHATYFKLRQRALHVSTEARRVEQFMQLLKTSSYKMDIDLGRQPGELMNLSHESCNYDYVCSTPELNRLCEIVQGEGAYG